MLATTAISRGAAAAAAAWRGPLAARLFAAQGGSSKEATGEVRRAR
jgi:hypothetical protein